MKTIVYLIRHGEVNYAFGPDGSKLIYGPDIHLSDLGRQQLIDLADQLKLDGVKLQTIFASPFIRAQESAAILHDALGAPVTIENDLHDLWMPGWIGKTMDYLYSLNGNIHNVPPLSDDQETLQKMSNRIISTINRLINESAGNTIAIVSHGDPLAAYVHHLLHPDAPANVDRDTNYPAKGQAMQVCFGPNGEFLSCKQYSVKSDLPKITY